MAYSAIEQRYVDLLATAAFPDATTEPEPMAEEPSLDGMQLAAGPSATRTDAPQGYGEIRAVQPTKLESALQTAGVTLEQIGRFVDGLGQVDVPGLGQMSLADLLPFVGSAKEGTRSVMGGPEWQGTPKMLQAPAEGKPLVTGTGQTLQLSKDAKLAAFDVLPAAQGLKTAAKGAKKGVQELAPVAGQMAEQLQARIWTHTRVEDVDPASRSLLVAGERLGVAPRDDVLRGRNARLRGRLHGARGAQPQHDPVELRGPRSGAGQLQGGPGVGAGRGFPRRGPARRAHPRQDGG